jgi:hypothetical protein
MLLTLRAIVREGKIEVLDNVELPEGAKALVTLLPNEENEFWMRASEASLKAIWDNQEDDVYAQLLKE